MQPSVKMTICLTILLLTGLWICSCADQDLLDQVDDTYQVYLTIGNDDSQDIDVIQNDCDDDPLIVDPEEFYGEVGSISIISSPDAPFLSIESYSVAYIPLESPLWSGGTAWPPNLAAPGRHGLSFTVEPNSERNQPLYNILTIDTKEYYAFHPQGYGQFIQGVYTIQVTLYGKNNGIDVELKADTVVRLMDVDNCGG